MYAYFGFSKIGYFVSVFQTSPGGKNHTQYRFVSICQVRYYFSQTILNYYKGQGHIISKVKSFQRWNISYSFFDRSIINSFIITFYIINSWEYQLYLWGRQQTMLFQNQQFLNPSPLSSFLSSKFYASLSQRVIRRESKTDSYSKDLACIAFCVKTFEPIMIQTCSAPQNDRLIFSFVKDIKVGVKKMTRNRRKMIEKTADSLLLSKHSIQFSALFLLLSAFTK